MFLWTIFLTEYGTGKMQSISHTVQLRVGGREKQRGDGILERKNERTKEREREEVRENIRFDKWKLDDVAVLTSTC